MPLAHRIPTPFAEPGLGAGELVNALPGAAVGAAARRWIGLAVGSLVIAGLLSLAVVIGRLPIISGFIADPLFFKRCLVVHVDLALVVWFYAFLAGLNGLRDPGGNGTFGRLVFTATVAGVGAMLAGALVRGAMPVLSNYIPVIDHPLFLGGLAVFFAGIVVSMIHSLARATGGNVSPSGNPILPSDAAVGVLAASAAIVLACATWVSTEAGLRGGLDVWTRFEFSAWGAGHVLQVANVCAMLAVWLWVLARATGSQVLTAGKARLLFTVLLAPHFAMPLLTMRGSLNNLYHNGATQLMRWGVFPIVLVVLALAIRHLVKHRSTAYDPSARTALAGFHASAGLTVLGFILGACIRSSTTLVPAHYHASLGAVTVAFMTAAYLLADRVCRGDAGSGLGGHFWRSTRRQLAVFGIGQAVFALGFGLGGIYGLGRKTYGAEQHVRGAGEITGLIVMGVGGLVAVAGGLWFLFLILREMRSWWGRRGPVSGLSVNQQSPYHE